jgi:hypothetical protein
MLKCSANSEQNIFALCPLWLKKIKDKSKKIKGSFGQASPAPSTQHPAPSTLLLFCLFISFIKFVLLYPQSAKQGK